MKANIQQLVSLLEVTTTGYDDSTIQRMAESIPEDISLMIYSIITNVRKTAMDKEIERVMGIVVEMEERLQMYDMLV
jgi:predicted DNA-binding protein YlxM (UPF0122 family)